MRSQQPAAWSDIDVARNSPDKRRNRRYLRVTTEPIDESEVPCLAYLVDCPRRGRVGIDICVACTEAGRILYRGSRRPIAIECMLTRLPKKPKLELVRRHTGDALDRPLLNELLGAAAVFVTAGLGLSQVERFLRLRGLQTVLVVDEMRRPVGTLSLTDIARARSVRTDGEGSTVAQAMRPVLHSLPTSASVLQALSLMWENRLHALVLTSPKGEAAGIVGEFELLRRLEPLLSEQG